MRARAAIVRERLVSAQPTGWRWRHVRAQLAFKLVYVLHRHRYNNSIDI